MIKITKEMIEEMYSGSDNQEAYETEDIVANTIRMKTEFDNGDELQINVYSHYIDNDKKKELINDGETDANKIFDKISFVDENYTIEYNDKFELEHDAKDYLIELHKEFKLDMKEGDLDLIEHNIEQHQESIQFRSKIESISLEELHAKVREMNKSVEIPDSYITEMIRPKEEVKAQSQVEIINQQPVVAQQPIKQRGMKL